jgi:uncharacterized protein
MVMVPDLVTAATKDDGSVDLGMWKSVQTALINHCEAGQPHGRPRRPSRDERAGDQGVALRRRHVRLGLRRPVLPVDQGREPGGTNGDTEILVPPSGHIAGIWARTDETRGVWKAPANEIIRGALDVERPITKAEQGC